MKIVRFKYSEALKQAAEGFLIGQFEAPTQFVEADHLPDLITAAMHIVTDAAWVQPEQTKDPLANVGSYEGGDEEDEEEEDD
jgi:hypothetical protein